MRSTLDHKRHELRQKGRDATDRKSMEPGSNANHSKNG
jgi:hypothetical protein